MSSIASDDSFLNDILSFTGEPTVSESPDFGSSSTGAVWAGGILWSPESLATNQESDARLRHNTKLTRSVLPELRATAYNRPPLSWSEATRGPPPGGPELTYTPADLRKRDDAITTHMRLRMMDVGSYQPYIRQAKKAIRFKDNESNKSYAKRVVEQATRLKMRAAQTREMNTMALSLGGLSIR